jgi:hypothetical protein
LVYTDEDMYDILDVLTITEIEHGGARAKATGKRRAG